MTKLKLFFNEEQFDNYRMVSRVLAYADISHNNYVGDSMGAFEFSVADFGKVAQSYMTQRHCQQDSTSICLGAEAPQTVVQRNVHGSVCNMYLHSPDYYLCQSHTRHQNGKRIFPSDVYCDITHLVIRTGQSGLNDHIEVLSSWL